MARILQRVYGAHNEPETVLRERKEHVITLSNYVEVVSAVKQHTCTIQFCRTAWPIYTFAASSRIFPAAALQRCVVTNGIDIVDTVAVPKNPYIYIYIYTKFHGNRLSGIKYAQGTYKRTFLNVR